MPIVHRGLLTLRRFRRGPLRVLASKLYSEPLLRLQCASVGDDLFDEEKYAKNSRPSLDLSRKAGNSIGRTRLNYSRRWDMRTFQVGDDCSIGYRPNSSLALLFRW